MARPQSIYPSADTQEGGTVLAFVYPPRNIAPYEADEKREDDYSSYGDHQAVLERVDHFLNFDMPVILVGADTANWQAFLDWSAAGGEFDYYPDAAEAVYSTYHIVSTGNKIEYRAPGLNQLMGLRFRQVIT